MPNLGQNRQFFVLCDLEIWQMTLRTKMAPLLTYFELCASFCSHWWIQTGVTVRKRPIWVKISDFFAHGNLEIWQMTVKNNRVPLLTNYFKLRSSFYSHLWTETWVMVRKHLNWDKIYFDLCDLDLWPLISVEQGYKKWGHPLSWLVTEDDNSTPVYNDSKYLTSSLIEIEPHTAITRILCS